MFRSSSKIPGWLVALVVLITAGVTVWAMLRKNGTWLADAVAYPQQVTQVLSPGAAALSPGALRPVAQGRPIPSIHAGLLPSHAERGPCTACHTVVDVVGRAIPMIQVMAAMPHQYRGGLCINCHRIKPSSGVVAGVSPLAAQATAAPTAPAAAGATEGAWLGMEVVPITNVTTSQYQLLPGTSGLVVAEAESVAAAAGIRAGDVVVQVNGQPVGDMVSFFQTTQNGRAPSGVVTIMRGGALHQVPLGGAAAGGGLQAGQVNGAPGWGQRQGYGGGGAGYGNGWNNPGAAAGTPPCPLR